MTRNNTRFLIELSAGLWRILEPFTRAEIAHAKTYEGAVKAAKEIERPPVRSATDIQRAPEPPPIGSLRRVFWNAGRAA